jgi:hypothetical protein
MERSDPHCSLLIANYIPLVNLHKFIVIIFTYSLNKIFKFLLNYFYVRIIMRMCNYRGYCTLLPGKCKSERFRLKHREVSCVRKKLSICLSVLIKNMAVLGKLPQKNLLN